MSADRDELARELRRVADRLRSMPLARLEQHVDDVRAVLGALAVAAADLEGAAGPARRTVPELPSAALGDQVEVLGTDLLLVAGTAGPGADEAVAAALAAVSTLRRDL
jgi:hypothetical protein